MRSMVSHLGLFAMLSLTSLASHALECAAPAECWQAERVDQRLTVWISDFSKMEGYPLTVHVMKFGATPLDTIIAQIPARAIGERCEGINTLGFALQGRKSFATGKVTGLEGKPLAAIFGQWGGRAKGGAFLGGRAQWAMVNDAGLNLSETLYALPMPITGGDVAFGVTSCDIQLTLQPAEQSIVAIDRTRDHRDSVLVPTAEVLGWTP